MQVARQAARLVLVLALLFAPPLAAQNVGDRVRLDATHPDGVPAHPAAGDNSFVRWAGGTMGRVTAFHNQSGWFQVTADDGAIGWFTRRYLTVLGPGDPDDEDGAANEILTYVIGTWNLEHLRDGASRGFPENGNGGPSLPPRTNADYAHIADLIVTQLDAKLLILNEINGRDDGTSTELDRLVGHLGTSWRYQLGSSGGNGRQRVAILFDTRFIRRNDCRELVVPETDVGGGDIFDRDPLACHVTLLDQGGAARNDLLVVGLHLASGQDEGPNHNAAMARLRTELHAAIGAGHFPADERDILLGGDLNASRYGGAAENFWDNFDSQRFAFVTLAPTDGALYPGTRLAGVPLQPRSQIDYLMASGVTRGLTDELVQLTATVRHDIMVSGFDAFRARASDHVPVVIRVRVTADTDQ